MATRSIKDVQLQPRNQRAGEIGPSPFPLLILALIIALMFIIKVRADDGAMVAHRMAQQAQSALPILVE